MSKVDVWLQPYLKYGFNAYAVPLFEQLEKKIETYQQMVDETDDEEAKNNYKEFIADWYEQAERLQQHIKDGLYVEDVICNDEGVFIDKEEMYDAKIEKLSEEISEFLEMKKNPMCTDENAETIMKEVKRLRRFKTNLTNKKKAFVQQVKLLRKIGE